MQVGNDILSLLEAKGAQVAKERHRGVILQPGALGDCLLTLPLVKIMKEALGLGGVDIIGHTDYIGIFPERSCVDSVRSLDSADLHRLFVEPAKFDLADWDPLIHVFADYSWIVTFLGEPDSHFEQNLIFTTNCSHSAEIITLSMTPPEGGIEHVAEFYVQQFARHDGVTLEQTDMAMDQVLIKVTQADRDRGIELVEEAGTDLSKRLVILHPGSGGRKKCWHVENFLSIAKALRGRGFEVLFLLGPAEIERLDADERARLHGVAPCLTDLPLAQVVGLFSCADAFVGNDSGATHLAAAMGVRTFAMFGPTDPALYRPIGPALTVFRDMERRFTLEPSPSLQKAVLAALAP